MTNPTSRWLDDDRQPRDLYELLGRQRFDPDTAGLLAPLKGANRPVTSPAQGRDSPPPRQEPLEHPAASLWDELDVVPPGRSAPAPAPTPLPRRNRSGGKARSRATLASRKGPGGGSSARSVTL